MRGLHRSPSCAWLLSMGLAAFAGEEPGGSREFALGVEYMVPGLAATYAKAGVTWAKAIGMGFSWGDIEPDPPVDGKHAYRWESTDRLILEYQRAGFRHFQLYVKCMNRWASSRPVKLIGGGSSPPKPEYLDDYVAYLRALVQRYDTKHPEHAPGLLHPVEYFEIEAEWGTGYWQGTGEEYLDLLRVAYPTVKAANPDAKVILIGFFLAGVFEGHPDPAEIPRTLAGLPPRRRAVAEQYLADIRALLAHPELFDVVEFHSLSDWSEVSGMARFLRRTMREYGYEKPIWVGDVNYTASPLLFWGIPIPPYAESQKPAIDATLRALANPRHPRHAEVEAWFRAEQASGLMKKVTLAMAEGMAGINVGNLKDEGIFSFVTGITGTVAFQGLIETKGNPPKPGEPRPAYHALALAARKLAGFSSVRSLQLGTGVHAYEFAVRGRPVHVLWFDDGRRYLPGDPQPTTRVRIPLPQRRHLLTETPTARGPSKTRTVSPTEGILELEVGPTPLLLEPLEDS